jgi:lipopolysaccharide export system protein LptC
MHDSGAGAFVGRERSDIVRRFRAARRHSRLVRLLRLAIPVGLIVCLAVVVAAAFFNPLRMLAKLPIDPGRMVVSGTKITMEAPRLGGFTRDGRPYELTAAAAAQDLTNPGVLELKDVRARVQMVDKSKVDIQAATGVYDTKADQLILKTDVLVVSSGGYEARMKEASIDIKQNKIVSEKPVDVKLVNGTLIANRMEVVENGELMRFSNGIELYLVPQAADQPTGQR